MPWYQIISAIVSVLTLVGVGTITKIYWENRNKKKIEESEEVKREQQKIRKKEIKDAVSEIVDPFAERIEGKMIEIDKRLQLTEQCDQAALRNSLMSLYYTCRDKGYRTEDDSKNYREMHEAYNAIGGNSFIDTDISIWFEKLPLKPNNFIPRGNKKERVTTKTTKQNK